MLSALLLSLAVGAEVPPDTQDVLFKSRVVVRARGVGHVASVNVAVNRVNVVRNVAVVNHAFVVNRAFVSYPYVPRVVVAGYPVYGSAVYGAVAAYGGCYGAAAYGCAPVAAPPAVSPANVNIQNTNGAPDQLRAMQAQLDQISAQVSAMTRALSVPK